LLTSSRSCSAVVGGGMRGPPEEGTTPTLRQTSRGERGSGSGLDQQDQTDLPSCPLLLSLLPRKSGFYAFIKPDKDCIALALMIRQGRDLPSPFETALIGTRDRLLAVFWTTASVQSEDRASTRRQTEKTAMHSAKWLSRVPPLAGFGLACFVLGILCAKGTTPPADAFAQAAESKEEPSTAVVPAA